MRKIWLTMAAMAMAVSLTACGGSKSQTGTETESSAAAEITAAGTAAETQAASSDATGSGDEKMADKDTMVIGCYGATQSMFPANDSKLPGAQIHVNLYDTLLTMDKDGEVQPLLAEEWEQVDEVTYRFKLKQGVKFHNGEELKASDVVFSMKILCEAAGTKSNTAQFDPEGFVAEDDYTVILKTKQPFSPFLRILCHPTISIFNEKFYEEHLAAGDLDLVECGTGPFMLSEWNEGENIVLVGAYMIHKKENRPERAAFLIFEGFADRFVARSRLLAAFLPRRAPCDK